MNQLDMLLETLGSFTTKSDHLSTSFLPVSYYPHRGLGTDSLVPWATFLPQNYSEQDPEQFPLSG